MSLETDQQKLEQQKLEQVKQEKKDPLDSIKEQSEQESSQEVKDYQSDQTIDNGSEQNYTPDTIEQKLEQVKPEKSLSGREPLDLIKEQSEQESSQEVKDYQSDQTIDNGSEQNYTPDTIEQKLEQVKPEKSLSGREPLDLIKEQSEQESRQELKDNQSDQTIDNGSEHNFITGTGENLSEWRSQRENKESSEVTEGASDKSLTPREPLDNVYKLLEPNQELTDNKFITDASEKLSEWRSQRENKESSEVTEGASDKSLTPREPLDNVYKLLEPNQELTDNKFITDASEKLSEWRSQRSVNENQDTSGSASSEGQSLIYDKEQVEQKNSLEPADTKSDQSLDKNLEQVEQKNSQSLDDNLDSTNVEPNPEDSTQDDTVLENQRKDLESDINQAQHELTNNIVEAQNAQKEYEHASREASEAEQEPNLKLDLQGWKNKRDATEKNAQATSDKVTEAEQNLQDLRRQLQDLPKPKR